MSPGKLEWYFMQPISAKYAKIEFASEGLNINVIYKPMPLDYIKIYFQTKVVLCITKFILYFT